MVRARLVAAKNGDELRNHGGDGRRHGEPRDDDQRKEEKDDGKVRQALEKVVGIRLRPAA